MTANTHSETSHATTVRCKSVYTEVHAAVSDQRSLIRIPRWSSLRRYFSFGSTPNSPLPLPTELLVEIFQYLSATEIASVQTVCRAFRDIVKQSAAFQFTIEVFVSGVVEGPAASLLSSSRARLDRLVDWKHIRRGHHWRKVWEEDASGADYKKTRRICGQTYSTFDSGTGMLRFTTLPSSIAGTSTKTWSVRLPQQTVDHWFDPAQELLVIRSLGFLGQNVPFLAFSHMRTVMPFLGAVCLTHPIDDQYEMYAHDVDVRILGDLILIFRDFTGSPARRDVTIHDWRRNTSVVTIFSDNEDRFLVEIAFLDADHLVGVMFTSAPSASVVVIPWRKLPGGNISITDAVAYATVFHLPQPKQGNLYPYMHMHDPTTKLICEHSTGKHETTSSDIPFFDAGRHPPLVVLNLTVAPDCGTDWVNDDVKTWSGLRKKRADLHFLIPGRTLMSRVAALDAAQVDGMREVPWTHWGEDTRVWPQRERRFTEVRAYGSRAFRRKTTKNWVSEKLIIYDFDSNESMLRDIRSGDKARLGEIVAKPSYLPESAYDYLLERVVTKAPYRRLESGIELDYLTNPSFGEDCFFGKYYGSEEKQIIAYSI